MTRILADVPIGSSEQLRLLHTSGSVNQLTATGSTTGNPVAFATAGTDTDRGLQLTPGGAGSVRIGANALSVPHTITSSGTTGNQTINKMKGRVNVAAAGTAITVTNNLVSANDKVDAVIATNDATATVKNTVCGAGTFTELIASFANGFNLL